MKLLLEIGLTNALLATAVAGIAVVASWLFRQRPALIHSLWLLVFLKLVAPPFVGFSVPWPNAEIQTPAAITPSSVSPVQGEETPAGLPHSPPTRSATAGDERALRPPAEPHELETAGAARSNAHAAFPWTLVGATWLLGAGLWWLVAGVRMARFQRSLRHAQPAAPVLQAQVRRLAGRVGLRKIPEVFLLPAPVAPLVWALGRSPRVLLPVALWARLSEEERQTLLVHELAHLRRRDHWVRRLELLALGLYWWHPIAWWAHRKLQDAEEQCCDAWVLWALPNCSGPYAQALVHTLRFVSRAALPVGASGIGQVPPVKRRLIMILQGTTPRRLSGIGLGAVVGLALLVLPVLPTLARSEQPGAPEKSDKTAKDAIHAAQIDKARADIKLLEAELAAKKVEIRDMESRLKKAQEQLAKLEGRHGTGIVFTVVGSQGQVAGVLDFQRTMVFAPGPLKIVKQASQPGAPKPSGGVRAILNGNMVIGVAPEEGNQSGGQKPSGGIGAGFDGTMVLHIVQARTPAQRLADLEKQMNVMLKEMAALRQQLQSHGTGKK